MTSPNDAVRGELRAALSDLADLLLADVRSPYQLLNAVRHLQALATLSILEEEAKENVRRVLHQIGLAVIYERQIDGHDYANQVTRLADRL